MTLPLGDLIYDMYCEAGRDEIDSVQRYLGLIHRRGTLTDPSPPLHVPYPVAEHALLA